MSTRMTYILKGIELDRVVVGPAFLPWGRDCVEKKHEVLLNRGTTQCSLVLWENVFTVQVRVYN